MIDEPYRWVEAIANRREYIESELATGSPTVGLSCVEGVLLLTFGKDRKKIFEIYDQIALGGIGHPGDIERLRMTAIELASTEGFSRSANDVSLRRMATYNFSPALKQAFEQIYGAPYLARLLFAEVGPTPAEDLFVTLDYDGS
ncbi:MAG: 20S proteasome subunit A/B, partial [Verrucomicrobia bacterium]|nr:20S proteasome subunit A/B [Verrucomicrobiota bacterium]